MVGLAADLRGRGADGVGAVAVRKIAIVATSLLLATAIPATAGHYGGDGGTNWGLRRSVVALETAGRRN